MASSGPTANYGWTKPVVGGDGDTWGDEINTDLDGIDATVKSVSNAIPGPASTPPVMDGTAAVGAGTTWARADHVHPSDTSKYAASNPSGYQTAAQVTASLVPYALTTAVPAASSTPPVMDGTTAVGAGTTWARADHVHPSDTSRLALTGGTMTGPLTLATDPAAALQSATKQYVDGVRWGDNRIINGDMRIDQRNGGASGTAINVYTVDRWQFQGTQTSKGTWGRNLNAFSPTAQFPYYFGFQANGYTPVAGDVFFLRQEIEADMISDFAWGTSSAQPVTLSFWVFSNNLTGTFGGAVRNYANTRSYPFTYSIPVASVWTKIVLTIPGDTAGTWALSGNGGALDLCFDFGSGATYRGPAGAWASVNYGSANGAVSVIATNGAELAITGVKLEIGSVATPFNRQSLTKSLADCQRYYQIMGALLLGGYNGAGGGLYAGYIPMVQMRAAPTVAFNTPTYVNGSGLAVSSVGAGSLNVASTVTAAGSSTVSFAANLTAEL